MTPALITDGCILNHESHKYRIRLHPREAIPVGHLFCPQVEVAVEALDDDGSSLAYFDDTVTTDEPESIEDAALILMDDLAAKCWPEHERIERERAEVRLQREIERDDGQRFSFEAFDVRR